MSHTYVYHSQGSKGYEKTPAPACNVVKVPGVTTSPSLLRNDVMLGINLERNNSKHVGMLANNRSDEQEYN